MATLAVIPVVIGYWEIVQGLPELRLEDKYAISLYLNHNQGEAAAAYCMLTYCGDGILLEWSFEILYTCRKYLLQIGR
jgi:hypothetical protein